MLKNMPTFLKGREDAPDLKFVVVNVTLSLTSAWAKLALQSASLSSPEYDVPMKVITWYWVFYEQHFLSNTKLRFCKIWNHF